MSAASSDGSNRVVQKLAAIVGTSQVHEKHLIIKDSERSLESRLCVLALGVNSSSIKWSVSSTFPVILCTI